MPPAASSSYPSLKAGLVLALVLPIFAIAPLLYPGYIQTHSGFIPIWNVVDLRANFGAWNWLPSIATQFDPLRSDGLLPYYLTGLLPVEPAAAVKSILGLGWLLGSLGMFVWLNRWLGPPGALVAALVYTYLPYRITTVYVRGAWGEALFWGLLPWVILISQQTTQTPQNVTSTPRRRTLHTLRFTLIFFLWLMLGLSQWGLALWALVFTLALLLTIYRRQTLWPSIASLLGIILAGVISFALLASPPLLFSSSPLFSDHFIYPFQLFSAFWGFGPSRAGWNDGLSLQLGLAALGLTILGVTSWQRQKGIDRRFIFFIGGVLFFILLQFGQTNFLWQIPLLPGFTLANTLTYPWQLSGFAGLCLAVLAGVALGVNTQLARLPLFSSVILLVILASYTYLEPQFIQPGSELRNGPQVQLGATQLGLLSYRFEVTIDANTAGLERSSAAKIPLKVYSPLQSNDILNLQVTWQSFQAFAEDWKIFVHLVDSKGKVLAQFDGHPLAGTYPTSHWIPGELIQDSYPLVFPPAAPPGPYRLFLGLYNEKTGQRLSVPGDTEGRVILNVE